MAKKEQAIEEVVDTKPQKTSVEKKITDDKIKVKKPLIKKMDIGDEPIKVDLTQPKKEEKDVPVQEQQTEKVDVQEQTIVSKNMGKEDKDKKEEVKEKEIETPILEEVTGEETTAEEAKEVVEDAVKEAEETGVDLPENIQKVVDFMDETGGTLDDYVKLNQDYTKLDETQLLSEYYQQTKPHLNNEEIAFLMEDEFSYDKDSDEDNVIKRKKLAFKEQVANARIHLDGLKSKYYEEIKSGSRLTSEQQKAIDFFNRYNKENKVTQKAAKQQKSVFLEKTDNVFNDSFKGFEYDVGEKKYRFNVQDANEIKTTQSDINNFVNKFVDKKTQLISDAKGYHKSLFTAMNADAVANHFYEQGRADGIKESISQSKNIDMNPRSSHEQVESGGLKVRVVSGDNTNRLRFKIKN